MRIDAHIHDIPPALAADLDAFIAAEPFWGLMLAPLPDGRSIQGWATAERMIADMGAAGIDKVVLMGEYRRSHEGCVARNDQALEIVRRWPDRVIAFAMLQPKAGQAALDELARCLDGGMSGVGELSPYGQGFVRPHLLGEIAQRERGRIAECLRAPLVGRVGPQRRTDHRAARGQRPSRPPDVQRADVPVAPAGGLPPLRVRRDASDGQVNFDETFGSVGHDAFDGSCHRLKSVSDGAKVC